jgi:hypothetical protein
MERENDRVKKRIDGLERFFLCNGEKAQMRQMVFKLKKNGSQGKQKTIAVLYRTQVFDGPAAGYRSTSRPKLGIGGA